MNPETYLQSLNNATKSLQIADHMTYITFPLVKEKRLLLKVLVELSSSLMHTINAILQYEFSMKRVQIYADAKANFDSFKKLTPKYNISPEQLNRLIEIITLSEKHKKSPFEFVKNDKVVIMSDGMSPSFLTLEKIKIFLTETKDILRKANNRIKSQQ